MVIKTFLFFMLAGFAGNAATPKEKIAVKAPRKNTVSRHFIFGSVSYMWWQEALVLTDPAGSSYPLTTNTHGLCFGAGYFYRLPGWDVSFHSCLMPGQSDVSNVQTTPRYTQRAVETLALFLSPGAHYRAGRQVSIGASLTGVVRKADWTIPRTGWTVEPNLRFSAGALLELQWRLNRVVLHQKVGPVVGLGTIWSVGLDYIF